MEGKGGKGAKLMKKAWTPKWPILCRNAEMAA